MAHMYVVNFSTEHTLSCLSFTQYKTKHLLKH